MNLINLHKSLVSRGISLAGMATLQLLGEHKCLNLTQIGQSHRITSAAITGIADKLERIGLVERSSTKAGRRVTLLTITEDGEKVLREVLAENSVAAPAEEG